MNPTDTITLALLSGAVDRMPLDDWQRAYAEGLRLLGALAVFHPRDRAYLFRQYLRHPYKITIEGT